MKKRCPDSECLGVAFLTGYQLDFTRYSTGWRCGVADIVRREGAEVWGLTYKISQYDLEKLDRCEGHPRYYRRTKVTVITRKGESRDVITYEVVNKEPFHPPSQHYLNVILKAAKEYDFPGAYRDYLESMKH